MTMANPAGNLGVWKPLTVDQVTSILATASFPWWIAGGWAIDLFIGHQTRPHDDIDVLFLRHDQLAVQTALAHWDLWAADPPGSLRRWSPGEVLPPHVHDIWCRRTPAAPWCLQLMVADADGEQWIFRRDSRITAPLVQIGRRTMSGVPFLSPQVQLLFKAKRPNRPKDELDFNSALPMLDLAGRQWLIDALTVTVPDHPWLERIGEAPSSR
jgi:hypothetical protein